MWISGNGCGVVVVVVFPMIINMGNAQRWRVVVVVVSGVVAKERQGVVVVSVRDDWRGKDRL